MSRDKTQERAFILDLQGGFFFFFFKFKSFNPKFSVSPWNIPLCCKTSVYDPSTDMIYLLICNHTNQTRRADEPIRGARNNKSNLK